MSFTKNARVVVGEKVKITDSMRTQLRAIGYAN